MGGDYAPEMEVGAAIKAVEDPHVHVYLYGRESEMMKFFPSGNVPERVTIINADDVIGMTDEASTIVKSRKESSLFKGVEALREKGIDAFISVGNTGAVLATSTMLCGRIRGVSRPTIGTFLPTETSTPTLLVDAGANVDSKALFLRDFGIMGSVYSELVLKKPNPTVGILNVGEERGKGKAVVKEAFKLLEESPVNFFGNVEGRDILKGTVDVVVCDGFEGNVVLKFAESIIGFLKTRFRAYAEKGIVQKLLMASFKPVFKKVLKDMDYQEYGGVPLLGINGVVIIGHGSSSVKAIHNMVRRAVEMVDLKVNDRIQEALQETQKTSKEGE